jgi:hypothetical protein
MYANIGQPDPSQFQAFVTGSAAKAAGKPVGAPLGNSVNT